MIESTYENATDLFGHPHTRESDQAKPKKEEVFPPEQRDKSQLVLPLDVEGRNL